MSAATVNRLKTKLSHTIEWAIAFTSYVLSFPRLALIAVFDLFYVFGQTFLALFFKPVRDAAAHVLVRVDDLLCDVSRSALLDPLSNRRRLMDASRLSARA